MEPIRFNDASAFREQAIELLMKREAQNNLIIGRCGALAEKLMPDDVLLALVKDSGRAVAAAMMTPPHHLVLTDAPDAAIEVLARWIHGNGLSLPGISGPVRATKVFLDRWNNLTGKVGRLHRSLRIYQLEKVIAPSPVDGSSAEADESDIDLLEHWWSEFGREIGEPTTTPGARESVATRLAGRQIFVWRNAEPVSMAAWAGPTPNGVRINLVYTPPEHRNRGYASACVAQLSRQLLDSGKKFCFLYTDLANPTSNKIYQRIGYEPVCDWADYAL